MSNNGSKQTLTIKINDVNPEAMNDVIGLINQALCEEGLVISSFYASHPDAMMKLEEDE